MALMAVAIQLVIASFHFHPGAVVSTVEHSVAVAVEFPSSDNPGAPSSTHDPICAACVLSQLAASAAHPDVPALDMPPFARWAAPATAVPELSSILTSRAFNARAPPVLWRLG